MKKKIVFLGIALVLICLAMYFVQQSNKPESRSETKVLDKNSKAALNEATTGYDTNDSVYQEEHSTTDTKVTQKLEDWLANTNVCSGAVFVEWLESTYQSGDYQALMDSTYKRRLQEDDINLTSECYKKLWRYMRDACATDDVSFFYLAGYETQSACIYEFEVVANNVREHELCYDFKHSVTFSYTVFPKEGGTFVPYSVKEPAVTQLPITIP